MRCRAGLVLQLHALGMFGGRGSVFELVFLNLLAGLVNLLGELVVALAVVRGVALCLNVVENGINPVVVLLAVGKVLDNTFFLDEDAVQLVVLLLGGGDRMFLPGIRRTVSHDEESKRHGCKVALADRR